MRARWAISFALCAVCAGCGSDPTPRATTTGGGGGSAPVLEPSLFDCTAKVEPERTSAVPVSCATDRACTTKLVSAHRVAGGALGVIAPENSLAAVRAAVALGVDFIETDPRETKDGVLVNVHDPSVDRTLDGVGEVAELTLAEIQALRVKADKFPGDFSCERAPTIEDVLRAARGKVHVLLDANKTSRVDALIGAIHATDTLDWAIFDTDSVAKIDEALALEPSLHTMLRVKDVAELDAELAHFAAHPPVIVEIHDTAEIEQLAGAIHAAHHRVLGDIFGADLTAHVTDDQAAIDAAYEAAYAKGLDIGQTDRPDLVLRYLRR